MSQVIKGLQFPNLFLSRPDGTSLELYDLWKKEHCLLILLDKPDKDVEAFVRHWQDQAKLFEWLNTRLLVAHAKREHIASPWPAPGMPPTLHPGPLPQGVDWGKAYVISKNRTLVEIYAQPSELSVAKVEKDMLYWEANHCLP
jgi:hypothetical protein